MQSIDITVTDDANSATKAIQTVSTQSIKKSDPFTAACSAMKEENISEGQRIVTSSDTMGKPQTVTAACEVMKDEAKRILTISE